MRKHKAKKLSLNRETLRSLHEPGLRQAEGGALLEERAVAGALSINVCTKVISDCLGCTTPLDGCPVLT